MVADAGGGPLEGTALDHIGVERGRLLPPKPLCRERSLRGGGAQAEERGRASPGGEPEGRKSPRTAERSQQ